MNEPIDQFAKSKSMTRIGGIFIMLVSAATLYYIFTSSEQSVPRIYVVLPFMFMLGFGLMLFPISKAETLHLYGTTQIPFKHMPLGMKICFGIGIVLTLMLLILQIL
ncbi:MULTISPECIES: hypothetical protein [Psychrobacter]|uniref:hypothetical protein n=1 Tax=Psychrobacter TaxID=497 RepID=UPI000C31BBE8|nr:MULTISPECIES: hypothetical protein [Psychrobacter]PKG34289.1 hypothetical protein CXF65_12045 [Psychrobacter sp. Sarcosine-3u-12]